MMLFWLVWLITVLQSYSLPDPLGVSFQDPLCRLFQPPSALGVCESAGPMPCLLCEVRVTLRATVVAAIRMQVWRYLG